jgi:hypothetical protein
MPSTTWSPRTSRLPTTTSSRTQRGHGALQTLPEAGTYAVPGLDFDRNYGSVVLGARTRLFGLDTNLGASLTPGQKAAGRQPVRQLQRPVLTRAVAPDAVSARRPALRRGGGGA